MTDVTGQRLTRPSPAIAGLVFVFGFWLLFSALFPNQNLQNIWQDAIVVVAEWFTVIVLFAIVVLWERLSFLSSVGLTLPARADWMLVGFFVLLAIAAFTFLAARHVTISVKGTMGAQLVGLPLWIRVSAVFSAGVCEEILFRGYAIERLKSLTGNIWIGGLIGAIFLRSRTFRDTDSVPGCWASPCSASSSRSYIFGVAIWRHALPCTGFSMASTC
jgi:membrane protease YdiL (CAAX protease family)